MLFQTYSSLISHDQSLIDKGITSVLNEQKLGEVGYYSLPENIALCQQAHEYNQKFKSSAIKDIVILGIGGSSLGTKAINRLLDYDCCYPHRQLHFFENCDPIETQQNLAKIDPTRCVILMISKSGSTIETITLAKVVCAHLKVDFDSSHWKDRFIIITDPLSPLESFANKHSLPLFFIPKNVGGRFSVLSAVGIVPLTLLGYNVNALLNGAKKAYESFVSSPQPLASKAAFMVSHASHYPINVLFSYSSRFEAFNDWYVQLWGESLGKLTPRNERVGLTPVGLIGSIDQHSFLQLIVQGPANKTVTFIKIHDFTTPLPIPSITFEGLESTDFVNGHELGELLKQQCDATAETLQELHVPIDILEIGSINEENIGALMMSFELLTSLCGAMFDVNTYDQPGVEFGKIRLRSKF